MTVNGESLENKKSVELLGLHIYHKLNFNYHITEMCKKVGRKINLLVRLSAHLDINSKLTLFTLSFDIIFNIVNLF